MINNAPARNNRGINEETRATTTTLTGSLLQKPVTLSAANLGSCDKNPGKADTTIDTGAIFEKKGGSLQIWFDPRGDGAKSVRRQAGRGETFEIFETSTPTARWMATQADLMFRKE
jgi:hypothetical protein